VSAIHDALIVNSDIDEKLVKGHVLLREGSDQIAMLEASNGEHWDTIHFGII
jgi:hypothetical protein